MTFTLVRPAMLIMISLSSTMSNGISTKSFLPLFWRALLCQALESSPFLRYFLSGRTERLRNADYCRAGVNSIPSRSGLSRSHRYSDIRALHCCLYVVVCGESQVWVFPFCFARYFRRPGISKTNLLERGGFDCLHAGIALRAR